MLINITLLFQAIADNATRREQEAVAAQRRAMREAEEELKRKMAANGGKAKKRATVAEAITQPPPFRFAHLEYQTSGKGQGPKEAKNRSSSCANAHFPLLQLLV